MEERKRKNKRMEERKSQIECERARAKN
jgi:hypothetical protein